MKISVKKAAPTVYVLTINDTEIALDANDTKALLLELTRVLVPGPGLDKSAEERSRDFVQRIKNANDVGIQKLLRVADHHDLLVLLKVGENDKALIKKFYGNMSERSQKIFVEDLAYQFKEDVSDETVSAAIWRLSVTAKELEDEGTLIYENLRTQ